MAQASQDYFTTHYRKRLYELVERCKKDDPMRTMQAVEALRRIEDGDYGFCLLCGLILPHARLELHPEAAYCAHCEARA